MVKMKKITETMMMKIITDDDDDDDDDDEVATPKPTVARREKLNMKMTLSKRG